jgi:hypothetical protein
MRRPNIAKLLERSPALAARIASARRVGAAGISFEPEQDRVSRVLVKLAMGHAAYDLAQECRRQPVSVWWHPLHLLSPEHREELDAPEVVTLLGEVGSRGMQRLRVAELNLKSQSGEELRQHIFLNDWVDVQLGRYRYLASHEGDEVSVRLVIGEYLIGEVRWQV